MQNDLPNPVTEPLNPAYHWFPSSPYHQQLEVDPYHAELGANMDGFGIFLIVVFLIVAALCGIAHLLGHIYYFVTRPTMYKDDGSPNDYH